MMKRMGVKMRNSIGAEIVLFQRNRLMEVKSMSFKGISGILKSLLKAKVLKLFHQFRCKGKELFTHLTINMTRM